MPTREDRSNPHHSNWRSHLKACNFFPIFRASRPSINYESRLNTKEMPTRGDRSTPTTSLTNATAAAVHVGAFSMTWLQEQAKQALIMNQY